MAADPDGSRRSYDITLVHGTFAPNAAWTGEGSSLRRALAERLGDVTFHAFAWSGLNSYADRAEAGAALARFLDERVAAAPGAVHGVIAHSHGGNIALYAGKHVTRPGSLANVACLATPFITCKRIRKGVFAGALMFLLCAVLGAAAGGAIGYYGNALLRTQGISEGWSLLLVAPLMLVIGLGGPYWLFARLRRSMAASAKARLAELAWPDLPATRLFVALYVFDEAKTYLDYLNRATSRLSRWLWRNAEWLLLGLIALAILTPFGTELFGLPSLVESESFEPYKVAVILLIYLLAVIALVLPVLRSNPYGYGWERLSSSWTLDITATERPDGLVVASYEECRMPVGGHRRRGELAHTVIYDDPRVQEKLAAWLAAAPAP